MRAVTRPRGPLPSRVYWTRRGLVLLFGLALVIGIARLLDVSADGGTSDVATTTGASPQAGTTSEPPTPTGPVEKRERAQADKKRDKDKKQPLAQPDGPCDDADVVVTPRIRGARVNEPIEVELLLTTVEADACTWEVDPESVFVTISEKDRILWSSQHCPGVIPTEAVIPRRQKADKVALMWNGMESDSDCSRVTPWVLPGAYTATAVARGSVLPVEVAFLLGDAVAPTETITPTPTKTPRADDEGNEDDAN